MDENGLLSEIFETIYFGTSRCSLLYLFDQLKEQTNSVGKEPINDSISEIYEKIPKIKKKILNILQGYAHGFCLVWTNSITNFV